MKKWIIFFLIVLSGLQLQAETSPEAVNPIDKLSRELRLKDADAYHKARIIYDWIGDHIAYDHAMLRSQDYSGYGGIEETALTVLRRGKGICAGYAALYKALADRAGLPCKVITGYAKGAGYEPGMHFSETNHAWNAVKIYGKWQLLDATWGAGSKESASRDYYFLCEPSRFVYDHLPENPAFQLLDRPWTLERFETAVHLFPGHKTLGVLNVSSPRVEGDSLVIELNSYHDIDFNLLIESQTGGKDRMIWNLTQRKQGNLYMLSVPLTDVSSGKIWLSGTRADGKGSGAVMRFGFTKNVEVTIL